MLSINDVANLIKAGRPSWIIQAEKEHEKLNVHVNGIGLDKYLQQISNCENEKQFKARKELAISNRFLFANLLRPIDKVFSAKGGSVSYQLSESQKKVLINKLTHVRGGMSIKKWIQEIQLNRLYVDPAGLVFFEWKDGITYPTVKSINSIYNYQCDGRIPEWVIFKPENRKDGTYYGVIDESFDYTVRQSPSGYSISEQ